MTSKPTNRIGRPSHYVKDEQGREIAGLRIHQTTGRYYDVGADGKRQYFGKEFALAVFRHKQWRGKQTGIEPLDNDLLEQTENVSRREFWKQYYRNLILSNPEKAAQELNCPPVARLADIDGIRPAPPSRLLVDLGNEWLNKVPALSKAYKKNAAPYWTEFVKSVGVSTVAQLTPDLFDAYKREIYKAGQGKSPRYVNNRFLVVGIVLNHALVRGNDVENIKSAIVLTKMLTRLTPNPFNPKPIKVSDYSRLIDGCKSDPKMSAVLLLALNCALYPVDLCSLNRSDIDLKTGTLCNRRTKNGVPRIAVLWDRTVKAVKAYLATRTDNFDCMFTTANNTRLSVQVLQRLWTNLRSAVAVDESETVTDPIRKVEFASIRDGAQTEAISGDADPVHVDMLLGHRAAGVRDNYLMRRPGMVADACAAIERAYFGSGASKQTSKGKRTVNGK